MGWERDKKCTKERCSKCLLLRSCKAREHLRWNPYPVSDRCVATFISAVALITSNPENVDTFSLN